MVNEKLIENLNIYVNNLHDHVVKDRIKKLIKKAIDENNINVQDDYGQTILYNMVDYNNIKLAKELLDNGADINLQEKCGYTPLMIAAAHNFLEIVELLLEYGANVNIKNIYNYTALDITFKQNPELISLLEKKTITKEKMIKRLKKLSER